MSTHVQLSICMSDINNWVDVDKSDAEYEIFNDDEITKAVNKEHTLDSEEQIPIDDNTVHSKHIS